MTKNQVVPSDSPPTTEIQAKDYIREQIAKLEDNELYMLYKESETPEQLAKMKVKQEKHFREKFDFLFPETKESIPSCQTKSPKHYSAGNRKVAVTSYQITDTLANAEKQTEEEVMDLVYDISTKNAALTTAHIMLNVYGESALYSLVGYLVIELVFKRLGGDGGASYAPFSMGHQSIEGYDMCMTPILDLPQDCLPITLLI